MKYLDNDVRSIYPSSGVRTAGVREHDFTFGWPHKGHPAVKVAVCFYISWGIWHGVNSEKAD